MRTVKATNPELHAMLGIQDTRRPDTVVLRMVRAGIIPHKRLSPRRVRFDLEEVQTWLGREMEQSLNVVTGFGADPTGIAYSTEAIQCAIGVAQKAKNGVVYVPAGTYKVKPKDKQAKLI